MEPIIFNGEHVLISSIPFLFSKPKVGNIIAFKKNKKIFVKRIAKISGEKYFVKGDNKKDSLDIGWIERKVILGKVIGKI